MKTLLTTYITAALFLAAPAPVALAAGSSPAAPRAPIPTARPAPVTPPRVGPVLARTPAPAAPALPTAPLHLAASPKVAEGAPVPVTPTAAPPVKPPLAAQQLAQFKRSIVLDVRATRSGAGDVSGGHLTAVDMVARLGHTGEVTMLVDDDALRILSATSGKTIVPGDVIYQGASGGTVRVQTPSSLPRSFPTADLYLSMAKPSQARAHIESQGRYEGTIGGPPVGPSAPLIDAKTIRVAQTVFGNSNDNHLSRPHANMWIGDEKFEVSPPGLDHHESGMYMDPTALALRGKTPDQLRKIVDASIDSVPQQAAREGLHDLLAGRALAGSQQGLVYGVGEPYTIPQFGSYLHGLLGQADAVTDASKKPSFTIVTPSKVRDGHIPPELASRVKLISLSQGQSLPAKAEPGVIYVVETPTLPREVFNGLLARSEFPPIVSGDNALSAALTLGKPFVMTRVQHNQRTVRAVGDRLLENAKTDDERELVKTLFGMSPAIAGRGQHDLKRVMELGASQHEGMFRSAGEAIEPLTDRVIASATRARAPVTYEAAMKTEDRGLRLSLMVKAADSDQRAARVVATYLEKNPDRALGMVVTGVLDGRALGNPQVRAAFAGVLKAHDSLWLQQFGRRLETQPAEAIAQLGTERVRLYFADPKKAAVP